jgi:uncharacterized protein YwgA/O-acetyl-ADP-ribose deacetylase (regulator of RNase III)
MKNVKVLKGDLFESKYQTFVNTVNCVGVMGAGIALEFKKRFPEMFKDYVNLCEQGKVKLGRPYLYKSFVLPWILNFPTKDHWRGVSRLIDIVEGLNYLKDNYRKWGITSLAIPALGTSHGQLEWKVVGPTMYRILERFDIPIEFYIPLNETVEDFEKILAGNEKDEKPLYKIKPGWIGLVKIVDEIKKEPYHYPVGRTMFQKIAYFATMEGLPTGFEYKRSSYGPFAQTLKQAITKLVNNGIITETPLGSMFEVNVGPAFNDALKNLNGELSEWSCIIEKVSDLFKRVNTQQAEIMATVHMAWHDIKSKGKDKPQASDVLTEVMEWKQKRRPPIDSERVRKSITSLAVLKWIDVNAPQKWLESELV